MSRGSIDDCYFYFNSSCSKGTACAFRHCEAAKKTQEVCPMWQASGCLNQDCPFRHSVPQPTRDRSRIACYWEHQAGGCRKPHCPFQHIKARDDKGTILSEEEMLATVTSPPPNQIMPMASEEEVAVKLYTTPPTLLPQDVNIPTQDSPKVEQLVINPFDEESDGDSVQGTPIKSVANQRLQELKMPLHTLRKLDGSESSDQGSKTRSADKSLPSGTDSESDLNFSVKSLDEIRKEKLARAKRLIEEADSLLSLEQKMAPDEEIDSSHTPVRAALKHVSQKLSQPAKERVAARRPTGKKSESNAGPKKLLTKDTKKTVLKVNTKPAANKDDSLGVKSLEEMLREKALASMRAAQEKKRLEAEAVTGKSEETSDSSQKDIPKTAVRRPLNRSIKARLGLKEIEEKSDKRAVRGKHMDSRSVVAARRVVAKGETTTEEEGTDSENRRMVKARLGTASVKNRLGVVPARRVEASNKVAGIKSRLGLSGTQTSDRLATRRTDSLSADSDNGQEDSAPVSDRSWNGRRSRAASHEDSDGDESLRSDDSLLQSDRSGSEIREEEKEERRSSSGEDEGDGSDVEELLRQREALLASLKETESGKRAPVKKAVGNKRKIQVKSDIDETGASPPKRRTVLQEEQTANKQNMPRRKVFVESKNTTADNVPLNVNKVVKLSAKSRLGPKTNIQITRTIEINKEDDKNYESESDEVPVEAVVQTKAVPVAKTKKLKRKLKASPEKKNAAKRREPRIQLYRPPGASNITTEGEQPNKKAKVLRKTKVKELEEPEEENDNQYEEKELEEDSDEASNKDMLTLARQSIRKRILTKNGDNAQEVKPAPAKKNWGGVKTFSEIMREKQLRKQQEQSINSAANSPIESRDKQAMEIDSSPEKAKPVTKEIDSNLSKRRIATTVASNASGAPNRVKNESLQSRLSPVIIFSNTEGIDTTKEGIQIATSAVTSSAIEFSENPSQDQPGKRKVRRNVWSTRDSAVQRINQDLNLESAPKSRKLNITRNTPITDDNLFTQPVQMSDTDSGSLFKKRINPISSRLGAGNAMPGKGRSPLLRNLDTASEGTKVAESKLKKNRTSEKPAVPISPIVVKSDEPKSWLSRQITPIGIRTESKWTDENLKRPDFLRVQIPKPATSSPQDAKLKSPKISPKTPTRLSPTPKQSFPSTSIISTKGSAHSSSSAPRRRSDGSSSGRKASIADDPANESDLWEAELLELGGDEEMVGSSGQPIEIPDDDALLMEVQELIS